MTGTSRSPVPTPSTPPRWSDSSSASWSSASGIPSSASSPTGCSSPSGRRTRSRRLLAFAVGALNGYIFNRRWTFAARDTTRARVLYVASRRSGRSRRACWSSLFVRGRRGGGHRLPRRCPAGDRGAVPRQSPRGPSATAEAQSVATLAASPRMERVRRFQRQTANADVRRDSKLSDVGHAHQGCTRPCWSLTVASCTATRWHDPPATSCRPVSGQPPSARRSPSCYVTDASGSRVHAAARPVQ